MNKKYFKVLLYLALTSCLMGSDFYIFSYRVAMRNGMLISEDYNISRSMVLPKYFNIKASCEIGAPLGDITVYYQIKTSKEEVLICLMKHGIGLRDDTTALNLMSRSTTSLWIAPVPIRAREVDGYAVIEILEVKE